jgi:hypothetical protein
MNLEDKLNQIWAQVSPIVDSNVLNGQGRLVPYHPVWSDPRGAGVYTTASEKGVEMFNIEPVENGWIVHYDGKKYLADTPEKITELVVRNTVRSRVTPTAKAK